MCRAHIHPEQILALLGVHHVSLRLRNQGFLQTCLLYLYPEPTTLHLHLLLLHLGALQFSEMLGSLAHGIRDHLCNLH